MYILPALILSFLLDFCIYATNEPLMFFVYPDKNHETPEDLKSKNFKIAAESIQDPSFYQSNQQFVQSQTVEGSAPVSKNIADIADKIPSAQVDHYGGQAGSLRLRLRGSRSFEPSYYFNGLPLVAVGSGEQHISLIPVGAVSSLQVYPDFAPFWLGASSIGGDVNILSCKRSDCMSFSQSQRSLFNMFTLRCGSFGYKELIYANSLKLNKNTEMYSTISYKQSIENYPIFNNNNSILYFKNGFYEERKNNDFSNKNLSLSSIHFWNPLGQLQFDFLMSEFELGIPAPVGVESHERSLRKLYLGTLSSEKSIASNGLFLKNQFGFLYNTSQSKNLDLSPISQANKAENLMLQFKSYVIFPSELFAQEQWGLALEVLNSDQITKNVIPLSSSVQLSNSSESRRLEVKPAFFQSVYLEGKNGLEISTQVQGSGSLAYEESKDTCNHCSTSDNKNIQNLYNYGLSIQGKLHTLITYLRYSHNNRRPYLTERYGSPSGVVANLNLRHEESRKWEMGMRTPFFEVGLFTAKDKNLIFLQNIYSHTFQYVNLEDGQRWGAFAIATTNPFKFWKNDVSYQFLNATMQRDGETKMVPRSARHFMMASTALANIPVGNLFGFETLWGIYLNANYQSEFYLDTGNNTKMKLPPLFNAGTALTFTNKYVEKKLSLSLDFYNILNETFSNVSDSTGFSQLVESNGYFGFPSPGRRFYLTLVGEF